MGLLQRWRIALARLDSTLRRYDADEAGGSASQRRVASEGNIPYKFIQSAFCLFEANSDFLGVHRVSALKNLLALRKMVNRRIRDERGARAELVR